MQVCVEIETCMDCRHRDHSGAFTKGGARQICGHSAACSERRSKTQFKKEYPMYSSDSKEKGWKYHWYHRILDNEKGELLPIPDWCPLKHGFKY